MAKKKNNTKNEIQIFCYKAMPVRTAEINGIIWFVAKDICDILELSDVSMAAQNLEPDEKSTAKVSTPSGMQDITIINESGLYTLIMKSSRAEAKPFRRWITHDVLPSIRKTGRYTAPNTKQETLPDICLPQGSAELAKNIFRLARTAENDNDFVELAAMDKLFKDFTGKSALNAAGMFIVSMPQIDSIENIYNLVRTEISHHYRLLGNQLPPLP